MKKYSIFSIAFIVLSGLFIYINSNDSTTMSILGINITLPNAVWMIGFLLLFYVFSLIFAAILRYQSFRFESNIKKDIKTIKENIKYKILGINKFSETKELNNINDFVQNINYLTISPMANEDFEFLSDIEKIKKGEVVELKKYKLDENNEWVILNKLNRLKNEESYAKTILKTSQNEKLLSRAKEIIAKSKNVDDILEFNIPISKELVIDNIENEKLSTLLENSELKNSDYIEIAQKAYELYNDPETLFELFEKQHFAYIYLLIEFEVIDKALEITKEHEIRFFEYYLLLREDGHKVDIKDFLNDRLF
jgi:hypothetical protein